MFKLIIIHVTHSRNKPYIAVKLTHTLYDPSSLFLEFSNILVDNLAVLYNKDKTSFNSNVFRECILASKECKFPLVESIQTFSSKKAMCFTTMITLTG